MRRRTSLFVSAIAMSSTLLLSGCIGFHGPNDLRRSIARDNDVRLQQEFGISTNGLTLKLARGIASPFVGKELPRVAGISRVQYGQYTVVPRSSDEIPDRMLRDMKLDGWDRVIRISEASGGDEVCVYTKDNGTILKGIVVAVRDGDELMLVRVKGDIEKFLATAMDSDWFDDIDIEIFPEHRYEDLPPSAEFEDEHRKAEPDRTHDSRSPYLAATTE